MRRHTLPVGSTRSDTEMARSARASVGEELQHPRREPLRVGEMGQMPLTSEYDKPDVPKRRGDDLGIRSAPGRAVAADHQEHGYVDRGGHGRIEGIGFVGPKLPGDGAGRSDRSEEHTSELQSR